MEKDKHLSPEVRKALTQELLHMASMLAEEDKVRFRETGRNMLMPEAVGALAIRAEEILKSGE